MAVTQTLSPLDALHEYLSARKGEKPWIKISGVVTQILPSAIRVEGLSPYVTLGNFVEIDAQGTMVLCAIICIEEDHVLVEALEDPANIALAQRCYFLGRHKLYPAMSWRGRILNALGAPIDSLGALPRGPKACSLELAAPTALNRRRVSQPLRTGVRVVDLFCPLCRGQRMGIFAGSGVGKSTLLAMLARCREADVIVICLVGERGREVREFLEDVIGAAREKTVFVVATADERAGLRRTAPLTALAIAEFFRSTGLHVLLMLDSITRYAHALRETALAAGELPVARGYTAGVFRDVPALLERAGPGLIGEGDMTAIFSVLVDGDDHNDPVADLMRGTLDGHIVLDRAIAEQGRYPAIHLGLSLSRLAQFCFTREQAALIMRLRGAVSRFEETRDMRLMGGYQPGQDGELDWAVRLVPKIYQALRQDFDAPVSVDAFAELAGLLAQETAGA